MTKRKRELLSDLKFARMCCVAHNDEERVDLTFDPAHNWWTIEVNDWDSGFSCDVVVMSNDSMKSIVEMYKAILESDMRMVNR